MHYSYKYTTVIILPHKQPLMLRNCDGEVREHGSYGNLSFKELSFNNVNVDIVFLKVSPPKIWDVASLHQCLSF